MQKKSVFKKEDYEGLFNTNGKMNFSYLNYLIIENDYIISKGINHYFVCSANFCIISLYSNGPVSFVAKFFHHLSPDFKIINVETCELV